MNAKNLRVTVRFRARPHDVYEALVDPRQHARFTGAAARLERRVGGRFSHWDGSLEGVVVALEKDRRLVLAWRSADWPEGHYSIADFLLEKAGGGTRLTFSQYGIPAEALSEIREGWKQFYWTPLKQFLDG